MSLLVSKMITAWKFVIIQPFHFKVIQISINLLLSKVQLVRRVITRSLPLSKSRCSGLISLCILWISDVLAGMDLSEKMYCYRRLPDACYGDRLAYPVPSKELCFDSHFVNIHD